MARQFWEQELPELEVRTLHVILLYGRSGFPKGLDLVVSFYSPIRFKDNCQRLLVNCPPSV